MFLSARDFGRHAENMHKKSKRQLIRMIFVVLTLICILICILTLISEYGMKPIRVVSTANVIGKYQGL